MSKNVGMNVIGAEYDPKGDGAWIEAEWSKFLIELNSLGDIKKVRFPFLAHRFNKQLPKIKVFLSECRKRNVKVLLDNHGYMRDENDKLLVNDGTLGRFWVNVIKSLAGFEDVISGYDIMNEPHDTNGTWFAIAQDTIDRIRAVDPDTEIHVEGDHWSGAHSWVGSTNNEFKPQGNNIVIHAHQYFDDNSSGLNYKENEKIDIALIEDRLGTWVQWLKDNNYRGAIGEFSVPQGNDEFIKAIYAYCQTVMDTPIDIYWHAMSPWGDPSDHRYLNKHSDDTRLLTLQQIAKSDEVVEPNPTPEPEPEPEEENETDETPIEETDDVTFETLFAEYSEKLRLEVIEECEKTHSTEVEKLVNALEAKHQEQLNNYVATLAAAREDLTKLQELINETFNELSNVQT